MISKITLSVAIGLALLASSIRLPAAMCTLSNAAGPKACQMDCCGSKSCCLTSHERTEPTKEPLAKAPTDQQNIAAIATQNGVRLPVDSTKTPGLFSRAKVCAHAQPTLALICIRLI